MLDSILPPVFVRQVLPKHTLEALLIGMCGTVVDDNVRAAGGWGEGPRDGGDGSSGSDRKPGQQQEAASRCVWTELTMPVMTAGLNLKPTLSDQAIAALVRGVEAAAEQPELQVGVARLKLKFDGVVLLLCVSWRLDNIDLRNPTKHGQSTFQLSAAPSRRPCFFCRVEPNGRGGHIQHDNCFVLFYSWCRGIEKESLRFNTKVLLSLVRKPGRGLNRPERWSTPLGSRSTAHAAFFATAQSPRCPSPKPLSLDVVSNYLFLTVRDLTDLSTLAIACARSRSLRCCVLFLVCLLFRNL